MGLGRYKCSFFLYYFLIYFYFALTSSKSCLVPPGDIQLLHYVNFRTCPFWPSPCIQPAECIRLFSRQYTLLKRNLCFQMPREVARQRLSMVGYAHRQDRFSSGETRNETRYTRGACNSTTAAIIYIWTTLMRQRFLNQQGPLDLSSVPYCACCIVVQIYWIMRYEIYEKTGSFIF